MRFTVLSKPSFRNVRLYVIVDAQTLGRRDPLRVAEAALRGGADCLQWRDKTGCDRDFLSAARALRRLTRCFKRLFVVNDRVEIALMCGADAVHLGHEDLPLAGARSWVGRRLLIGRSTHSLAQARQAQREGADYLGVGPVFSTPTKPDYRVVGLSLLGEVQRTVRIPWVAIGGIDLKTLPAVLSAGATRVAVVRAVCRAADPQKAARAFQAVLSRR